MFAAMSRRVTRAQQAGAGRRGRRDDRVGVDAGVDQRVPGQRHAEVLAQNDRDDGRVSRAGVVAHGVQMRAHVIRVFPQVDDVLRLALHDFQRLEHRGHVRRRQGRRKNQRARPVLDVMHGLGAAGDEAADGGEALAEGAHDQVDLVRQAEMRRRAAPSAGYAQAMGVVDHDARAVTLADLDQFRQRSRDRPSCCKRRRPPPVCRHRGQPRQHAVQAVHVVVKKALHLAARHDAAIDDAGVVVLVHMTKSPLPTIAEIVPTLVW